MKNHDAYVDTATAEIAPDIIVEDAPMPINPPAPIPMPMQQDQYYNPYGARQNFNYNENVYVHSNPMNMSGDNDYDDDYDDIRPVRTDPVKIIITLTFCAVILIATILCSLIIYKIFVEQDYGTEFFGRLYDTEDENDEPYILPQNEEESCSRYDKAYIKGSGVIDVIRNYAEDNVFVAVTAKTEPKTEVLAYDGSQTTGKIKYIKDDSGKLDEAEEEDLLIAAADPSDPSYIDPEGEFYGLVNRDSENGEIQGISFFRVK